jgi:4-hydroxyproline epimerase
MDRQTVVLENVVPRNPLIMIDAQSFHRIRVIDSHTCGEPTRVVVSGGPPLAGSTMADKRITLQNRFDHFRRAVVNEPRGSDVIVGALLCEPCDPSCVAGVLFFNNVGPLWMCGHGTIGLAVTLGYLGRIGAGAYRLDTAVGPVTFEYDGANTVSFENVPSYRWAKDVVLEVSGVGTVTGDIAWGGNWFFLVDATTLPDFEMRQSSNSSKATFDQSDIERLTEIAWRIRTALSTSGITGADGNEIDHIELFGMPADRRHQSRNFVLCPGRAYDRSPCGTGTSAKLACLFADAQLKQGEVWRQESILGTVFEGSVRLDKGDMIPQISGTAYITAETTLLFDPRDQIIPFPVS